jgi:trimeric autotransporter adhesin
MGHAPDEVAQLRAELAEVRAELAELRRERGAPTPAATNGRPAVGRRDMLRAAGAAAVGGVVATVAAAPPAAAANGDSLTLGTANSATAQTSLDAGEAGVGLRVETALGTGRGVEGRATAETGPAWGVVGLSHSLGGVGVYGQSFGTGGAAAGVVGHCAAPGAGVVGVGTGTGTGVRGVANSVDGYGVLSLGRAKVDGALEVTERVTAARVDADRVVARSANAPALDGRSAGNRGAVLNGKQAHLRLVPRAGRPTSGLAGDLFVDKQARLWFCKGGTSWIRLA